MKPAFEDPAERGKLSYFYHNWRPTRFGRLWSKAFAWITGLGLLPRAVLTLQVRHRISGEMTSTVLALAEHEGHRYLVSMLGNDSEWVQNVRAASGRVVIKAGRAEPVVLVEIGPEDRAPLLKAWCQVATSGRKHLPVAPDAPLSAFAAIATEFPVFRVDPAPG